MRKYDPNGKAQTILGLLCDGPADMDQVYAAAGVQHRPNIRKKFFHVMLSLVEDGLAQRGAANDFAITATGRRALDTLRSGETHYVPEATPGLRYRRSAA